MLKTWDIFDTLIARRCVSPHMIFRIVEQISKIKNFVPLRLTAERNVSTIPNYTLDDIYDEFQRLTNAPKNICNTLKKVECDVEFNQSIPITENILQVKSGDILISDMYMPKIFVQKLLNKNGLLVPVEIIITSGGKSSGRIWKSFAEQKKFLYHIGDNPESDIKKPQFAGFESALTVLSNPNLIEQYLMQKDFNFGAYLREIRLRNPFSEEIKRLYWQLFTLNIGILILFVQQIDKLQKKYGFEYLGFCGRDTYYMHLLYEKYKRKCGESPTPNDYLYYSRKLVRSSGEEMAKYFSTKIDNRKALMVDLVGSGVHLNYLREKFNLDYSVLMCGYNGKESGKVYFKDFATPKNWIVCLTEDLPTYKNKLNLCFLDFKSSAINDSVENLNRAPHNSPIRLKMFDIEKDFLPEVTFSEANDMENFDVLEKCFSEVLKSELVLPNNLSKNLTQLTEVLFQLLNFLNSFQVQIPLRKKHKLVEQVDIEMVKLINNTSVQKK